MDVIVGSTNPTKIKPVRDIFRLHFPDAEVQGIQISSGVSDQPFGDREIYNGAYMRAKQSIHHRDTVSYGVGIEGGIVKRPFGFFEYSLVVIMNRKGEVGIGSSGGLVLPKIIIDKINKGMNLEQVIDEIFGTEKIGEGIGMFGVMTNGVVTREAGVKHGVAFALSRFLHKDIFQTD